MSCLDGAASVMSRARTGTYGFRDFTQAAKAGGHAAWLWLCGSEPAGSEVAQGWPHFYQWTNGAIHPGGLEAGLDWACPGVLDALRARHPARSGASTRATETPSHLSRSRSAPKVRISYTARTTRRCPRLSVRYARSAQPPDSPAWTGTASPAHRHWPFCCIKPRHARR